MIELERIYGLLSSFLGESRQGGYIEGVTQYQFNCPYCADEKGYVDGKFNMECSLELLKFHCWVDGYYGSLSKLIKRWGGRNLLSEYYELVKSLKENELYSDVEPLNLIKETSEPLKLPSSFRKLNLRACSNKTLRAYANKRHLDQWTINKFNIGYTEKNEDDNSWSYRLIVPSYNEFGQLNYFVGRDYLPENPEYKRIKYKNCDADKKEIVFQESLVDWDADITLVEGTLDCIYGPNTIGLLGKTLTKDTALFQTLINRANAKVIICLDNDTKEIETLKICRLLDSTRLQGRIYYVQMNEYKDFGEAFEKDGVKGIVKCLRSAKKYDKDKDF